MPIVAHVILGNNYRRQTLLQCATHKNNNHVESDQAHLNLEILQVNCCTVSQV